jgi:hypothetical protein
MFSNPSIDRPKRFSFSRHARVELIAGSLEQQFQINPSPDLSEVSEYHQSLTTIKITNSNTFTTPGTTQNLINNLRKKKAPGDDLITNTAFKLLPKNILLSLTQIINCSFKICYFPLAWKKAVIISIPKPGKDHNHLSNYQLYRKGHLLEENSRKTNDSTSR